MQFFSNLCAKNTKTLKMSQYNYIYFYFLLTFLNVDIYCQRPLQGLYGSPNMSAICPSEIYCFGEILEDIQMARIYPDSKTFVDMKLLKNEIDIINIYRNMKAQNNGQVPNRADLLNFINMNFAEDPLIEWIPTDLNVAPPVANNITDPSYRKWILELNNIWKILARKVDDDVRINPDRHSSLYLPNGFFVAGGRFRELYYWDSYWIIRGALTCNMKITVKGILENFIHLVKLYGYVPNGNRIYYLQRSQPPLLIQMVASYMKFTDDIKFLRENIEHLETEFNFWMKNRLIEVEKAGNTYLMAQYSSHTKGPRPESYYEDKTLAMSLPTSIDKNELYSRFKSAAESGWDFSSKHYNNFGQNTGNLTFTDPYNFIYVELNSILQANAEVLSDMFHILGNIDKQKYYSEIGDRFQIGIDALLWNEEDGIWYDYDLTKMSNRKYFYASNLAPLWSGSYNKKIKKYYGKRALDYLILNKYITPNLMPALICIPASSEKWTEQQWDYPNCWPPLQIITIQGLYNTDFGPAQTAALNLAQMWIKTNYDGYTKTQKMFEKYNAVTLGSSGGGGEYSPQDGFGWTNGVVFELFWTWGTKFTNNS